MSKRYRILRQNCPSERVTVVYAEERCIAQFELHGE
jgi:hypothetical protein